MTWETCEPHGCCPCSVRAHAVVAEQAEDVNLWRTVDTSLHEDYLQQALRRLHAAIEEEAS